MSRLRFLLCTVLTVFLCVSSFAKTATMLVADQEDFDNMMPSLKALLKEGNTEVDVILKSGVYYFSERHVDFDRMFYPNSVVRIIGEDAVLISKGIRTKDFDPFSSYFSGSGEYCSFEGEMQKALGPAELVDADNKIYKIKLPFKAKKASQGYIYLTMWYRGLPFKITETKGNEVYFKAVDLTASPGTFDPSWDMKYGKDYPRFKLINTNCNRLNRAIFKCENSTFISCTSCSLKGLYVSGLRFEGNRFDPSEEKKKGLIRLYCCQVGSTLIENCYFSNIQNDCINITQVHNVTVRSCRFEDCYRSCVFSHRSTKATRIEDNIVERCGKCGDNVQLFSCQGEDFVVKGNTVSDFGYGAISAGVHYSSDKGGNVTGVISGNEIFQTPDYYRNAPMNLLMDGGAVYILTQNDKVVIEDNYIHDINGPRDNRGIFCDDGTCNVEVNGNKVEHIANSFCIDLRLVLSVETEERSKVRRVNTGNKIRDNIVDGQVRFEHHP